MSTHFRQPVPVGFDSNNYLTGSPERDIGSLMNLEEGIDWVSYSRLYRVLT